MPSPARLPLPTLLSWALVAFTIEFDNEFEHRTPTWTTRHGGSRAGVWAGSLVMWSNCMRFVGEDGVRVGELEKLARTKTNLKGMERWGYITIAPDPADTRPKPPQSAWLIRATSKGRRCAEIWAQLPGEIEERWRARFGAEEIGRMRNALLALARRMNPNLPDCMPILGYGLTCKGPDEPVTGQTHADFPDLATLLSKVLLAFALEFEWESDYSLAIGANVLRVLDESGVRVRELPVLSGVSKEAIAMALGFLRKKGAAVEEADPAGARAKIVRLTGKGLAAQDAYRRLLETIEGRWRNSFGEDAIGELRQTLGQISGRLFEGLEPYPDGWRAHVPKPGTLPHFPMVLHRGGWPDGC